MHSLKFNLVVVFAVLGLLTGSAHAFGPMMLLMLPMMTGNHHAMGDSHGAREENRGHTSHAEQSHLATAGTQPIPPTDQSEPSQARSEAESEPAPRENTH